MESLNINIYWGAHARATQRNWRRWIFNYSNQNWQTDTHTHWWRWRLAVRVPYRRRNVWQRKSAFFAFVELEFCAFAGSFENLIKIYHVCSGRCSAVMSHALCVYVWWRKLNFLQFNSHICVFNDYIRIYNVNSKVENRRKCVRRTKKQEIEIKQKAGAADSTRQ